MHIPTDCRPNGGSTTFKAQDWAIVAVSSLEKVAILE